MEELEKFDESPMFGDFEDEPAYEPDDIPNVPGWFEQIDDFPCPPL